MAPAWRDPQVGLGDVSTATQVALAISVISLAYLSYRTVVGVVECIQNALALLPRQHKGRSSKHGREGGPSVILPPPASPPRHPSPKPSGVSLRRLLASNKPHRPAGPGPDRELASGLFLLTLRGHVGPVQSLSWAPDGSGLASAGGDWVRLFDARGLGAAAAENLGLGSSGGAGAGRLNQRALPPVKAVRAATHPRALPARGVELRRGCTSAAWLGLPGEVAVQSADTDGTASLLLLSFPPFQSGQQPASDGSRAQDAAAHAWFADPRAAREVAVAWCKERLHGSATGRSLARASASLGGEGLVASCAEGSASLALMGADGRELGEVHSGTLENYGVALSADGRWLAAPGFGADVRVWEATWDRRGAWTGLRRAMQLSGHAARVTAVAFSPDLDACATASADGSLRVWGLDVRFQLGEDARTRVVAHPGLPSHAPFLHRLAWGPDGVLVGAAGAALLWIDARTGKVLAREDRAHEAAVSALEWSPAKMAWGGGMVSVLASGGEDARVRFWRGPERG